MDDRWGEKIHLAADSHGLTKDWEGAKSYAGAGFVAGGRGHPPLQSQCCQGCWSVTLDKLFFACCQSSGVFRLRNMERLNPAVTSSCSSRIRSGVSEKSASTLLRPSASARSAMTPNWLRYMAQRGWRCPAAEGTVTVAAADWASASR